MYGVLRPGGKAVIFDLRKDAAQTDINAAVDEMGLGRINSLVARWTFKHMLLKRAYLQRTLDEWLPRLSSAHATSR